MNKRWLLVRRNCEPSGGSTQRVYAESKCDRVELLIHRCTAFQPGILTSLIGCDTGSAFPNPFNCRVDRCSFFFLIQFARSIGLDLNWSTVCDFCSCTAHAAFSLQYFHELRETFLHTHSISALRSPCNRWLILLVFIAGMLRSSFKS